VLVVEGVLEVLPLAIPLNDDTVTPGFLGFGVFVALAVATVFLVRSMNKRMKNIQAPREADLKQQEWERAQQAARPKSEGAESDAEPGAEPGKAAATGKAGETGKAGGTGKAEAAGPVGGAKGAKDSG
jgi:hypothetical protein